MLDERKTSILRAIVHEYIATAQPVGSTHIASAPGVHVSSATVRNEMAVLEQEGYLAQPHTSAGRVPTDKGYRFFVDHMTEPGLLDEASARQVSLFFDATHGRLEELLHQTANLLAHLTHHASVLVGPPPDRAVVRSVQVVGLSARVAVVVAVLSSGSVENETIELADDVTEVRIAAASAHLQRMLTGRPIEPGDLTASGDADVDIVCQAAHHALAGAVQRESVFVSGTSVVAQSFEAVETVRAVLHTLRRMEERAGSVGHAALLPFAGENPRPLVGDGVRVRGDGFASVKFSQHDHTAGCFVLVQDFQLDPFVWAGLPGFVFGECGVWEHALMQRRNRVSGKRGIQPASRVIAITSHRRLQNLPPQALREFWRPDRLESRCACLS